MTVESAETQADTPPTGGDPQTKVNLLRDSAAPAEAYADGLLGIMVRDAVFKLDFYSIMARNAESGEETWKACQRIVLPITAAPQLLASLQQMLQGLQQSGRLQVRQSEAPSDATSQQPTTQG